MVKKKMAKTKTHKHTDCNSSLNTTNLEVPILHYLVITWSQYHSCALEQLQTMIPVRKNLKDQL